MPIFLILFFSGLILANAFAQPDEYKLEKLIVLFRHGDRTPGEREIYEGDPNEEIFKKIGYGQLTKVGKLREYKIGKFLRQRYDSFLGEYQNDVYAYSTNSDRTKMSLQLVLAGLYPPTLSTAWSDSLNWQPIPTHYGNANVNFLSEAFACPKFQELHQRIAFTPEMLKIFNAHEELFRKIKNNTDITISQLFTAYQVYSNLRSTLSLGLPLPAWCSQEDFNELEKLAGLNYKALTHTEQLRRMIAGPIVEQFLKVLKENDESKKIYLYSGHDINVSPFIESHNITGAPSIPDVGSALVLEKLRGPDDRYYLRVYLWTGVTEKFIPLEIPKCQKTCLLSDYETIVQPILPKQASRICKPTGFCKRRIESAEIMDLDFQMSRLFAGPDLSSFKYMKDFVTVKRS